MSKIRVIPLGAGQDVGRSCVLVELGNKRIMFDCGMHMGYKDERRFPDFSYISPLVSRAVVDQKVPQVMDTYTNLVDCVIVSHFHLDHCGAMPYFTEQCGYNGPVLMTYPTKAIAPILLSDFRRIMVEREGKKDFFTQEDIVNCMKKVRALNLHETILIDDVLEITPYYAGHVLGAAMFHVKNLQTGTDVVYTGDYNMTPDRHLGAASISRIKPSLLISESTYATTVRDSKSSRERLILQQVHECIKNDGKVLIPVFALGRAQELCILLETYWERMNLKVPIYFSAGLVQKANLYYKLFINWTNEKIKQTFVQKNMFDFKHIQPFDRSMMKQPGPMVVFATPGMLHAGMSLEIFKQWAPDPKNMVILPGYCVAGTIGNKVLHTKTGKIKIDNRTTIDMKCSVSKISFSAHADAKGILKLISQCQPKNVLLVHGEGPKMKFLAKKISEDFKISTFHPANGEVCEISLPLPKIEVDFSLQLLKEANQKVIHGIFISDNNGKNPRVVDPREAASTLGLRHHKIKFQEVKDIKDESFWPKLVEALAKAFSNMQFDETSCTHHSISFRQNKPSIVIVSWNTKDNHLAKEMISVFDQTLCALLQQP